MLGIDRKHRIARLQQVSHYLMRGPSRIGRRSHHGNGSALPQDRAQCLVPGQRVGNRRQIGRPGSVGNGLPAP